MRVRAFAKINLSLRVVGRRPDGYHDLRTVFQSIALHDTLDVREVDGPFSIACDDPACPVDRSNLVWLAAQAIWRAAGRRGSVKGATATVMKRIPMQAGLGGGSSNAAAALRVFRTLWAPRVPDAELRRIGAVLGADVPFFFDGGTALGLDRGDTVYPLLDRPPGWVVVVVPPFGISTREAFTWWDHARSSPKRRATANDLQAEVARRHPAIRRISARLAPGATVAGMSGTGSAVFGIYQSRTAAARAARAARDDGVVIVTRTLNRRSYQRLAASGLPQLGPIDYT
jgi:4-diphosphocytidyl-2-C-methyl-D-erythritol kinase